MRNVRFGVMISKVATEGNDPVADAQLAEALGFDMVTVHPDHMHRTGPTLETWTTLTWIAAQTSTIRVAPAVLSLPYRHPAVLAKMAETLDRLSGGRLVLPLGGGNDQWFGGAFRVLGLAQRTPSETVEATEEALDILHGLWGETAFSYPGRHFHVEGASIDPKPAHPIALWLGAYGPKMLDLVGRKADGWLPSLAVLEPGAAYAKLQAIRQAASSAGRDPDALTYAYNVGVRVGEAPHAPKTMIAGGAAAVAERLAEFIQHGFTYLNLWPHGEFVEQVQRLAWEVIPLVRELVR